MDSNVEQNLLNSQRTAVQIMICVRTGTPIALIRADTELSVYQQSIS